MMSIFSNIVVVKLMLLPTTRDYSGSYRRNINLNLTHDTYNTLENIMHNNPLGVNNQISTTSIANGLSNIVSYNPMAFSIDLPNGISNKRYVFILRVDVPDILTVYYIQGYTDYYDPSIGGKIDPNMNFNINIIHEFQRATDQFGNTMLRHTCSYNMLKNGGVSRLNIYQPVDMLIRPSDVYTGMLMNNYTDDNHVNIASWYDKNIKTCNKENIEPVRYIEKILNGYITSNNLNRDVDDSDTLLANCAYFVSEPIVANNVFMLTLSSRKGGINISSFTLNDLASIDNTLLTNPAGRLEIFDTSPMVDVVRDHHHGCNVSNNLLTVTNGSNQLQPNLDIIIANRVIHSVTALMSECLITKLIFSFTNRTLDGQPLITIIHSNSFLEGVNIIYFTNMLETRIRTYLVPNLISYGLGIEMYVSIDAIEDSIISINIDGNGDNVFVFPTFCDSIMNPLITNSENYNNVVNDFDNLTEVVNNSMGSIVRSNSNIGYIEYNGIR